MSKTEAQQSILVNSVFTLSPGTAAMTDHCRMAVYSNGGVFGSQPAGRQRQDQRATCEEGFFLTSEMIEPEKHEIAEGAELKG